MQGKPSAEVLRALKERLRYDGLSGKLLWRKKVAKKIRVGDEAGFVVSGSRIIQIFVNGTRWTGTSENIIQYLLTGKWDDMAPRNSTTGKIGVTYNGGRWIAQIQMNNTAWQLGSFDTKEEAAAARKGAESVLRKPGTKKGA